MGRYGVLALPGGDRVLIADAANHAIREYSFSTEIVRTVAGHAAGRRGCHDSGSTTDAGMNYPTGLALDPISNTTVFIADRGNNCIRAMKGESLWTVAGNCCSGSWGLRDGAGDSALFSGPTAISAVPDPATPGGAILYVTDGGNNAVRVITLTGSSSATVATLRVPAFAQAPNLKLHFPTGIAAVRTAKGLSLAVSDSLNGRIVRFDEVVGATANALVAVAGTGEYGFNDGPAASASFRGPQGLLWDETSHELLVADTLNQRIRSVSATSALASLHSPAVGTGSHQFGLPQHDRRSSMSTKFNGDLVRVMVWTGHSGPYHDHFNNGAVLAAALNSTGKYSAWLACDKDEKTSCEAAFNTELLQKFDVILVYADT